ncbi:MAG: hypothetical protein ABSF63_08030 [Candidatus Bathyarchaeia archaeon]
MQDQNTAVVMQVIPVSIHQDQFYDIQFYYEVDPKKTPQSCRLGPEAVPSGVCPGMRVRVKTMLNTILSLESIT